MILDADGKPLRRSIGFLTEFVRVVATPAAEPVELVSTAHIDLEEEYEPLELGSLNTAGGYARFAALSR